MIAKEAEQVNSTDSQQEISGCFEAAIKKLDEVDSYANKKKSEIVQELARDLEGKMPTDEIAAEIVHQLRGRISERRIYECLKGEQYEKYKKKHRVENARKRQGQKRQVELAAEPVSMSHAVTYGVRLWTNNQLFYNASIVSSPYHPRNSTTFYIHTKGVVD